MQKEKKQQRRGEKDINMCASMRRRHTTGNVHHRVTCYHSTSMSSEYPFTVVAVGSIDLPSILQNEQYRLVRILSMCSTNSMKRDEILSIPKYREYVNHRNI